MNRMRAENAYRTSIPLDAEERIRKRFDHGGPREADYFLNDERVGFREFFSTGDLMQERTFKSGVRHGVDYRWDDPGVLLSAEPYEEGLPHGTAYQWSHDGRLIGTYTLERGTGIDLWRQDWSDGTVTLAEAHYLKEGVPHGFEWWIDYDQKSVYSERHWQKGQFHGIERQWNHESKLRRGYPKYWVRNQRVDKRKYIRATAKDPTLPPFLTEDNSPRREFPPEIRVHLHPNPPAME